MAGDPAKQQQAAERLKAAVRDYFETELVPKLKTEVEALIQRELSEVYGHLQTLYNLVEETKTASVMEEAYKRFVMHEARKFIEAEYVPDAGEVTGNGDDSDGEGEPVKKGRKSRG